MASLKDVKRRIRSVKNTSQITKAMEVVSATKMRRSQQTALQGRPYALAALDILKNISARVSVRPLLLTPREIKKTLIAVVTSDKGLAGAFNSNVMRNVERWMKENKSADYAIITIGKKARDYFLARKIATLHSFIGFGDYVSRDETEPFADFLLKGYMNKEWDRVLVFYTNFRTTLRQEAKVVEVLPIHTEKIEETIKGITPEFGKYADIRAGETASKFKYEYKFEPSPVEVLASLLPVLFKIQTHHMVLESNASEHSARMVAMKNASENAKELIGELTIVYNKSRQAGITRELSEITAGREALEA
ncbi:MAG: ATP synthase F1 subunit gamma [bacterium]|nr:ATP synthase F1 subunit gamma [bacterium]